MNAQKKRRRPSPAIIAVATAAILLLSFAAANWLAVRRARLRAHVEIAPPTIEVAATPVAAHPTSAIFPDGEVERTALRVREVSALVIGLTLFAVNEALAKRPVDDVETLLDRFIARGLLPPDVERSSATGALVSAHAKIIIRYRAEPLGLEVFSLGRERADGPAILGRILTGEETAGSSLFIARQLGAVPFPAPFSSKHQITAAGWSEEPFRELALTPQELEQIQSWLQQPHSEK